MTVVWASRSICSRMRWRSSSARSRTWPASSSSWRRSGPPRPPRASAAMPPQRRALQAARSWPRSRLRWLPSWPTWPGQSWMRRCSSTQCHAHCQLAKHRSAEALLQVDAIIEVTFPCMPSNSHSLVLSTALTSHLLLSMSFLLLCRQRPPVQSSSALSSQLCGVSTSRL